MMNNKPTSSSLRDWLISLTAKELEMDEALVEKVVNWSYIKAKEATQDSNTIEFSGFGKLLISSGKASRKLAKWVARMKLFEDYGDNPVHKDKYEKAEKEYNKLKARIDATELERNNRGVEKQLVPTETAERADKTDTRGEAEHLSKLSIQQHEGENS